ncbi:pyrroline-5-carboxylate reductase family protein [Erythrobacter litoralis]|uniref:Pyrroline-5-carboxylate reductase n=1 Tax=Erythrobacter litoralis (strain HTCC2594) TaxID=314225 RepID=Q2NCY1_ERYLH|nr:pyrroline-5-carboxylate reductase [Erythrobacter litoralis]ABC62460.1 pyrroline-5-carboxylate reductase [Erythrobacter litoralis HTCC2594]
MTDIRNMLIVGFGTMTGAMVEGWLKAGIAPEVFTVYHPRGKDVPEGVRLVTDWPTERFDAVLLGVKPYMLDDVAPGLARAVSDKTVVLSVLAGIELASLRARFPQAEGVVRFMPNLACALGKAPNGLIGEGLSDTQRGMVTDLAEKLGSAEWLEDESRFDLVTALAGSGPGFVYRFIDALAVAGTRLGLDEGQAGRLAIQMVEGAAALAAQSEHSPGELARRVASPGGMTQKGLDVLDENDALVDLLTQTLRAARDRGAEMAAEAREKG